MTRRSRRGQARVRPECNLCGNGAAEIQTVIWIGDPAQQFDACETCFAAYLKQTVAAWMNDPARLALAERLRAAATLVSSVPVPPSAPSVPVTDTGTVALQPANFEQRTTSGATDFALFRRDGRVIFVRWDALSPEFRAAIHNKRRRSTAS